MSAAAGPLEVVLATANPHKAEEIARIMGDLVRLVPRPAGVPEVEEDAPDLEGNARLKAVALCEATGLPALADDTGLEVDALGGRPGVRSSRYAGDDATYEDNFRLLLQELEGVPAESRTARFRTVALLAFPDGREVVGVGVVEGRITESPSGTGGFGYDPVFAPEGAGGRTFAEMPAEEKNAISHRGRALRDLADRLRAEP